MRTCFGPFVLDDVEKQLLCAGSPVHLTPKAYGLLLYLVEQGRRAVSKSELLEQVWPGTFVCESTLTSVVKEVRRALGDDARRPRFVRGVRGFGYAFCGEPPSTEEGPASVSAGGSCEFRIVWQDRERALSQGDNLLGRTHEAAVWVEDASVSRHHALIRIAGDRVTLEDCGSKNGTFLRGERLDAPQTLESGDEFWLGRARLTFLRCDIGVGTVSDTSGASVPPRRQD